MNDKALALPGQRLMCEECRRPWLDDRERWRLYLDPDEPAHAVPYCPACAAREFDPD
ncbi:MAG TPA: hypothetical protein VE757_00575 [Gaiellaceae bacterium]|nr:hypothetical protein [Gaiellaceae bacterium]